MQDATLIDACKLCIDAFKAIDSGLPEGEKLFADIMPTFTHAINTAATTVEGRAAKARLCLISKNDDLLASLVKDVAALA